VVDREQLLVGVIHRAERRELLPRVDRVPGHRRFVRVRAEDDPRRRATAAGDEPAAFVRLGLERVRDELLAKPRGEDDVLGQP
jgi:hypothetical protein